MSVRIVLGLATSLALAACGSGESTEDNGIAEAVVQSGAVVEAPALPEECDAADYRPLIGTPVAAAALPADEMLRVYGVNDIVTQEYLPRRTNIVVGTDGNILRVTCG